MTNKALLAALGAVLVLTTLSGYTAAEGDSPEIISIGTMAPKKSPWGQVLRAWAKDVEERSGGKLALELHYDAQQGDESEMVAKLKDGQLDGALLTSRGLFKIHKRFSALRMPGLFKHHKKWNAALDAIEPELAGLARKKGILIGGLGDAGRFRMMSKGKAIRVPDDLKTMKVYRWDKGVIGQVQASVIGYPAVPSSTPALLANLSSGRINVIEATSLEAAQLQWWTHLDHVVQTPIAVDIHGLVFSKERLNALPRKHKRILLETSADAIVSLSERIRTEDNKAFGMLKSRMTLVDHTKEERAKWRKAYAAVRDELAAGTFTTSFVEKIEALAK